MKKNRDIGFEEVISIMAQGGLLDVISHPNQKKYPGQKMYVISHRGYVHLVPFVEKGEAIFLKTIIPSRKYTKRFQLLSRKGVTHDRINKERKKNPEQL